MEVSSKPLKITFWKNKIPTRQMCRWTDPNENKLVSLDDYHEVIYTWSTPEDFFDGIEDTDYRNDLNQLLFDKLNEKKPPEERGIIVLKEFVKKAEMGLHENKVEWIISQSDGGFYHEEENGTKINALLALTLHLKWLIECFGDQPGISVTVR
ncbi:MAG: hypothetical protein OXD45_05710 [Rhodobacteraceae bacterium]|nr:hypothetical protein [Paracoccaceae bacterium]